MKKNKILAFMMAIAFCTALLMQPGIVMAKETDTFVIEEGNDYSGFKCVGISELKESDSVLYTLEHVNTGAQLVWVKNSDTNKGFAITFKTPADNDKGIPHIIEHSVLGGSEKYPLKSPFFRLESQSLKTFLNAFTTSAYTYYPLASRNDKDFNNLVSVYLDAIFSPKFLENEKIFMEQGIRKEIFKQEDPIVYNGVVYNEMKGYEPDPYRNLNRLVNRTLYPDTPYRFYSAGDPEEIQQLTYEEFKEFYLSYYQPSNALFYFYGDLYLPEYLEYINDEYLVSYEKQEKVEIQRQPESGRKLENTAYYPMRRVTGDGSFLTHKKVMAEKWGCCTE
jgi:Zn-dependent M16 (insulinase) family peptidase